MFSKHAGNNACACPDVRFQLATILSSTDATSSYWPTGATIDLNSSMSQDRVAVEKHEPRLASRGIR